MKALQQWVRSLQKAAAMEGADFVALILEGGDPNGVNKSIDELIEVVKEVAACSGLSTCCRGL